MDHGTSAGLHPWLKFPTLFFSFSLTLSLFSRAEKKNLTDCMVRLIVAFNPLSSLFVVVFAVAVVFVRVHDSLLLPKVHPQMHFSVVRKYHGGNLTKRRNDYL